MATHNLLLERPSGAPAPKRQSLYAPRKKIYPKRASGRFRQFKWLVMLITLTIYYVTPWIRWDRGPGAPDQAVLVDLANRRFFFFFIEIWPQEFYYVAGMLVMAGIGLFLVTSTVGRAWCGYACPQTVWVDLFLVVERAIEGDRTARMRLEAAPWTFDKIWKRVVKHGTWLAIGVATGGAWIYYFADAPTLLHQVVTLQAPVIAYGTIALLTATTYVFGGLMREQVCTYMCPWPRFQAAMLDEQSLIVTYQKWRGEPRGKHKASESWDGRGDCVDCNLCVAVCPMGIDIRDGQQMECIGCGLCIDACVPTMEKVGRPRGLIRWDTLARQQLRELGGSNLRWRIVRPRTILYAALFASVAILMTVVFALRNDSDLSVQRDRSPNFVRLSNGDIRNTYTVKISNKTQEARQFRLALEGLPGTSITIANGEEKASGIQYLATEANSVTTFRVLLTVPADVAPVGSKPIEFAIFDAHGRERASHDAVFVGPIRQGG